MSCGAVRTLAGSFLCSMLGANVLAADKTGFIEFRVIVPQRPYFPFASFPQVPAYLVIRSSADWIAFWSVPGRLSSPVPNVGHLDPIAHVPAPDVDFEHFTLLAVVGRKPSSGYAVSISSVREQGAGILVSVLDVGPGGAGCAVATMITYPSIFAVIPKTDEPVRFQISQAKTDCNIPLRTIGGETP
jgi:hypothetical protein